MDRDDQAIDCCVPPAEMAPLAPDELERLVAVFRALGDPTRLEILRLIAAQPEPLCVCDVVDSFAVSQPTVSHHLKVLREAGLVTVSRRGVWAYYAADPRGLRALDDARHLLTSVHQEPVVGTEPARPTVIVGAVPVTAPVTAQVAPRALFLRT